MTDPTQLVDAMEGLLDGIERAAGRHPVVRRGKREPIRRSVRLAVLFRDGFHCAWCDASYDLEMDHILPWSAGGSDRSENLRPLCSWHNTARSNYLDVTEPRRLPCALMCDRCQRERYWPYGSGHSPFYALLAEEGGLGALFRAHAAFREHPLDQPLRCFCVSCSDVSHCSSLGMLV